MTAGPQNFDFRNLRGVILVPRGSILVTKGSPGDSKGDPWGSEVASCSFLMELFWCHFGNCFWLFGVKVGGEMVNLFLLIRFVWKENPSAAPTP